MILIVAGGVVAYTYKEEAISTFKGNMKDKMSHYRPGTIDDDTVVWDAIQQRLQCCGIDSQRDWADHHESYKDANKKYPESCKGKAFVYVDGCMLKIQEEIRVRHWSIGGAIAGVFIYLLVSIVIACMVLKNINTEEEQLIFQMNEKNMQNGIDNQGMQIRV